MNAALEWCVRLLAKAAQTASQRQPSDHLSRFVKNPENIAAAGPLQDGTFL